MSWTKTGQWYQSGSDQWSHHRQVISSTFEHKLLDSPNISGLSHFLNIRCVVNIIKKMNIVSFSVNMMEIKVSFLSRKCTNYYFNVFSGQQEGTLDRFASFSYAPCLILVVKIERWIQLIQNMGRMWWMTPGNSFSQKKLQGIPNIPLTNFG